MSKPLVQVNNAAIMGGTLTLFGASTNLVAGGLAHEQNLFGEGTRLPIFGITPVGYILIVLSMVYIFFASPFL